jgi:MFS transporter, DHA1 family, tetracycline resistance protein
MADIDDSEYITEVASNPREFRRRAVSAATTTKSLLRQLYEALTPSDIGPLILAVFLASFAFSAFESQLIFLTSDD